MPEALKKSPRTKTEIDAALDKIEVEGSNQEMKVERARLRKERLDK